MPDYASTQILFCYVCSYVATSSPSSSHRRSHVNLLFLRNVVLVIIYGGALGESFVVGPRVAYTGEGGGGHAHLSSAAEIP